MKYAKAIVAAAAGVLAFAVALIVTGDVDTALRVLAGAAAATLAVLAGPANRSARKPPDT